MNDMPSLAFVLPVTPGRAEEWSCWFEEILGTRRSEYHAFRRRLGLGIHRIYLQQTPQGEKAIVYLQGNDLQRAFEELRTAQETPSQLLCSGRQPSKNHSRKPTPPLHRI